jgi:septum site-determining protein MinC
MLLKGISDGILIEIADLDKDIIELKEKLENKKFFSGNVEFILKSKDKKYYKQILKLVEEYGHTLYIIKSEDIVLEEKKIEIKSEIENDKSIKEDKVTVIKKTLRSGQKFEFDGTVILMGDLNAGAELFANGDVYIFGRARGVVHAGRGGDRTREIVALSLEMSQIRIADLFAKSDEKKESGLVAERAAISDNGIIEVNEYKWIEKRA